MSACEEIREHLTLQLTCEPAGERFPGLLIVATLFTFPDGQPLDIELNPKTHVISDGGETCRWLNGAQSDGWRLYLPVIRHICRVSGLELEDGAISTGYKTTEDLMECLLVLAAACVRIACLTDQQLRERLSLADLLVGAEASLATRHTLENVECLTDGPGAYEIIYGGRIVHVDSTSSLRARLREHGKGASFAAFRVYPTGSLGEAREVEARLIREWNPHRPDIPVREDGV